MIDPEKKSCNFCPLTVDLWFIVKGNKFFFTPLSIFLFKWNHRNCLRNIFFCSLVCRLDLGRPTLLCRYTYMTSKRSPGCSMKTWQTWPTREKEKLNHICQSLNREKLTTRNCCYPRSSLVRRVWIVTLYYLCIEVLELVHKTHTNLANTYASLIYHQLYQILLSIVRMRTFSWNLARDYENQRHTPISFCEKIENNLLS